MGDDVIMPLAVGEELLEHSLELLYEDALHCGVFFGTGRSHAGLELLVI